jgi:TolB protein
MRVLVVLAALAALTVLLLPTSSATPAAAPSQSELAFVRGEGSATEILVVRADRSRPRRLTRNRFSDFSPIWSPDGRQILFVSNRDGDDELYVMDANGRDVRQLTRNRRQDLTPQWSPDGSLIAFASDRKRPGQPEIWVMRADGRGARRLLTTLDHPTWQDLQYSPAWSPDGQWLIFSMTAAESNPELYRVAVDGSGLTRLTRTAGGSEVYGDDTMPDWSADGKAVIFVSNREQRSSDIWTMRPDGSGQRPLMRRAKTDDWNPRLSPDGRTIAFTEHVIGTGARSVWVARRDGTGARRLIDGAEPDWRPSPTAAASTAARDEIESLVRKGDDS